MKLGYICLLSTVIFITVLIIVCKFHESVVYDENGKNVGYFVQYGLLGPWLEVKNVEWGFFHKIQRFAAVSYFSIFALACFALLYVQKIESGPKITRDTNVD